MKDYEMMDCGQFNGCMLGYIDIACKYAGIPAEEAERVHCKAVYALDMYSAQEAESIYMNGLPETLR